MHARTHSRTLTHTHTHKHRPLTHRPLTHRIHTRAHERTHVCMHARTHTHTHTHTNECVHIPIVICAVERERDTAMGICFILRSLPFMCSH